MTDARSTIQLIFDGIDNASEVARKVGASLGDLTDSAQSISAPFADLAGKLAVVQGAMTALAGVIGALAFNEAAKMQASLADLQKQMDASEGSAEKFGRELETLALRYGQNNNELVKSAADFKAAGYDINTSLELVKGSLDLAIAGSIETSGAVDVMNRSLAGFQVPAGDVVATSRLIGDVLNKAADITKSSFSELAQGFADLSPIAKQTGLSVQETAAILTTVIDVFGSGSEAANGLKSGFLSLVDPSKESAAAMKSLGVEYKNADGSIKSVKQILEELAPAFSKVDESQKLAAASIIFGKDQAGKMVQVMTQYGEAMDRAAVLTREAGGSIEREVTIRLGLAETAIERTDEAFRQLLQTLGDQTLINTGGVIGAIGDLAVAFRDVIRGGGLDPLFAALRPQLAEVETLFKTIAANLPAAFDGIKFDGLIAAFGDLKVSAKIALEALFGPIDLTTVDGLRGAIQKIVDLLEGLTRVTAGELGGLAPFLAGIRELAEGFAGAEAGTQNFIGTLLGLGVGINAASGYMDAINTALLAFIALGPRLAAIPAAISGVVAGFSAFAASSAGLAAGMAGVATSVGVLAFEITRLSGLDKTLNDVLAPDWLAGYQGASLGTLAADIAEKLGLMGPAASDAASGIQALSPAFEAETKAAAETRKEINGWLDAQEAAARQAGDSKAEIDALARFWEKLGYAYNTATGELTKLNQEQAKSKDAFALPDNVKVEQYITDIKGAVAINDALVVSYSQIGGGTVKATGAFKSVGDSASEQAKKVDEATKASENFRLKMEEIASNERIKNIEAVVSLKTEQLKADVERVKATFASVDTTIKSTGDLLGSLFGNLVGTDDPFKASKIESQIALENERREKALEIQRKLAEAEIERINAQTRALDRGDALIKVEAAGLEPHLEAIWFQIMKFIRVRVNASAEDYLLGTQ